LTPQDAIMLLAIEFIDRFGCDAEGCAKTEEVHAALLALFTEHKMGTLCPSCKVKL
jgi:hypothetical protein